MNQGNSGVSPTIAVVLLVAVTVILSALVFGTVFKTTPTSESGLSNVAGNVVEQSDGVHITLISVGSEPVDVTRNGDVLYTFNESQVGAEIVVGNISEGDEISLVVNGTKRTVVQSYSVKEAASGADVTVVSEGSDGGSTSPESISWSLGDDGGTSSRSIQQRGSHIRLGYPSSETGLVAYWKLDGVSGSVTDSTGNGNDGSNSGATRGVNGILGTNSFSFSGGEMDSVPFTATNKIPAGNQKYAIAAWFNASTGDCGCGIIGWGDYGSKNETNALRLRPMGSDSEISFRHYWWGNDLDKNTTTPYGNDWHFVVAQFDGTNRELWLDGNKIVSDTPTGHDATRNNSSIGDTNSGEYWNGTLDEIRVYDSALSSSDISFLNNGVKSGTYTSTWKSMDSSYNGTALNLTNVNASLNGQSATVYVESDVDGDGTVDETSDAIALGATSEYNVTGLTQSSSRFRIQVNLNTTTITTTSTVSQIDLKAE